MVKRYIFVLAVLILSACSNPLDVRFGTNPSEDLQKNAEKLKKLPADDLAVLSSYVSYAEKSELKGHPNPVIGKTVKEVLQDAKSWNKAQLDAAREQRDREEAAQMRAAKFEHDRKELQDKVAATVTVTLVSRTILPPNPVTKRTDPIIRLEYDVENRASKAILALKGKGVYKDLFGNKIVEHPFQTDKTVPIGGRIRVPFNYRVSPLWVEMMNLASAEEGKYFFSFSADALSFEDGVTYSISAFESQATPEAAPSSAAPPAPGTPPAAAPPPSAAPPPAAVPASPSSPVSPPKPAN
jgi:hypothetical protein